MDGKTRSLSNGVLKKMLHHAKKFVLKNRLNAYSYEVLTADQIDDTVWILRFTHTVVPNGNIDEARQEYEYLCFDVKGNIVSCYDGDLGSKWHELIRWKNYEIIWKEEDHE